MSLTSKRQLPNLNNDKIRQLNSALLSTENDLRHAQQSFKSLKQTRFLADTSRDNDRSSTVQQNGSVRSTDDSNGSSVFSNGEGSIRQENERTMTRSQMIDRDLNGKISSTKHDSIMDKVVQSRFDRRLLEIEREIKHNKQEHPRTFTIHSREEPAASFHTESSRHSESRSDQNPTKKILLTQQNSTNLRESAKTIRESVMQLKDELMRNEVNHDRQTHRGEDLLLLLNRRRNTEQDHPYNENEQSLSHPTTSSKSPNINYKKELEKHESQREQLADQLEALTRTCEQKDKLLSKTSAELKEATESSDTFERQNLKLQHDLTIALQRLEEMTEQAEQFAQESLNSQKLLADAEQKREEYQIQVQEANKQWKARAQKMEKDIERHKLDSAHLAEKNEQLIKEIDSHKLQHLNLREQMMKVETDLNEANMNYNRLEELCKRKESDIMQLQHIRSSHEEEATVLKETVNELTSQISTQRQRLLQMDKEKQDMHHRLQDEITERSHRELKMKHYEQEIEASSTSLSQLQQQILELENERKKSSQKIKEIQFERDRLSEEKARLLSFETDYHDIKTKLEITKIDHRRSLTALQIDYEKKIESFQSQLSDEKVRINTLQRYELEQKKEIERLQDKAAKFEEETIQKQYTIETLSRETHDKGRFIAELESKVYKLTVEMTNQKNHIIRKDDDYQHSLQTIYDDIVHCTGCLSTDSSRPFSIESAITPRDGMEVWSSKLKAHFTWLKQELEHRQEQEKKLRQDLNNTLLDCEADRVYFASELVKREAIINKLTNDHHEDVQRKSLDSQLEYNQQRILTEDERDHIDGRYRQFQTLIDSVKRDLQTAKVQLSA